MDKIAMILIGIIIVIVAIILIKRRKVAPEKEVETLIDIEDVPNINKAPRLAPKINPNFIEAKFHSDFMDVISAFNDISPSQRQIFNINNVPCDVQKGVDVERVGEIVQEFINELNEDIKKNVPLIHTANTGWDEVVPEHTVESGWEKVQRQLGLPTSLFNKPKMNTSVSLESYSHVIKYETENEIKYSCKVVLAKDKVKDKLVIQISIVQPKGMDKNQVIIETIDILGYLTEQGLGVDRQKTDDFYYFDSLDRREGNILTGDVILQELVKKYDMKQQVMQERIDGMDMDVKDKYRTSPSPAAYDSYKLTQTIIDDMTKDKKFN